jgi:NAD(P)-dependent dehydrogenase (short-subunit alcohol dehydrogenase family)
MLRFAFLMYWETDSVCSSNTLACGPFESKMMAATLKSFGDTIKAGVPLGRIGTPQDVAGACLFLSSRAGSFVNGATITLSTAEAPSLPSCEQLYEQFGFEYS